MTRSRLEFKSKQKKKIIAGFLFAAVIFFVTLANGGSMVGEIKGQEEKQPDINLISQNTGELDIEPKTGEAPKAETESIKEDFIIVDVEGAVVSPGILILPEGTRVYEAVSQAGGITDEGELQDINLAETLLDGQKLYIPSKKEYEKETAASQAAQLKNQSSNTGNTGKNKKVNLNTAGQAELQTLTGIGPSTAEKIIEYRQANGKFKRIEDIKNIKGIGEKTFQKLKEFISVT